MSASGEKLARSLGQPVVVENRPGAGGTSGADAVAKATPDGHTLLMTHQGIAAINPHLYGKNMPYDPVRDLQPVSGTHSMANVRKTREQMVDEVREIVALRDHQAPQVRVEAGIATAFGCTLQGAVAHGHVVVQAEAQQHGLFDPLVCHPCAVDLFSHANLAGVQLINDVVDGVAHFGGGAGSRQFGAVFPGLVDGVLEAHAWSRKVEIKWIG